MKPRPHLRSFAIWMGVYALMHLPMMMLMGLTETYFTVLLPLQWIFVILPFIPMLFALRALVHDIGAMDELQQRIHLEALAFSLGCTSMLTFSYGMMEAFADVEHISVFWVLPMAIFFWLFGLGVARRRYHEE
jgi:cadmium resistance protein CadD (predicted permease)